ncbi:MAG: hypothetical protein AB1635_19335 [Acidobacteriota bacterium]
MAVERQALVLGGAALVAAAAAWWMFGPVGASSPDGPARAARPERPAPAAAVTLPGELRLSALERPRESPDSEGRNPFRFGSRPAAAPPPRSTVPQAPAAEAPVSRAPAGPPPAPPIALKFIGLVERSDGMRVAVLSDGRVTLHGTEGAIIDGRYRILKIGLESIEVAYLDGRGRQTIRLTGQ